MLQVRENKISLRNSSGGPEYLRTLEGTLLTMQCKWTFTKRFMLATNKIPRVTVTITKKASLAAIARYISITTIYTVRYLQIFKAGHSFQVSTAMICKERSIGLPWFSTKPQIMTLFYLTSMAAPSLYIQLN